MNPVDNIDAQLRALQESYRQQLPAKLAQVDAAWNGPANTPGAEGLQEFHRLVHTLTGSGATFGFSALSDAAYSLESFLKELTANGQAATEEQRAQIAVLLRALHEAAAKPDDAKPAPDEGAQRARRAVPGQRPDRGQRLIYLVEDDAHLAQEVSMQLGYYGYGVRCFTSSSLLQAALAQQMPAAVVMDVVFPEGPRAASSLALHLEKPLPLVFMSSRGDLPARLLAVRAGGTAYFTKPLDIAALIDKLDELTSAESPDPYRVLIVDDSPSLAAFYAFTLQQAAMITHVVTNPQRLLETLSEFNPELILMDMHMPGCSGEELAKVIRQQEAYVSVPIVFLSTETDTGKQLAAMQTGGDDFLTKPIRPEHLISAAAARVRRYRVLRSYMERDSLTGLLNHTKIKEQLEVEVNRARRQGRSLAFVMIDIDRFKLVNDTYGHPTGDRVIKSLSHLLQQRLRRTDIVGRYGGEEFAVILTDTDGPTAAKLLDEIRAAFARVRQQADGGEFSVTFSCGVAEFSRFGSAADLGSAADKALYEAKRGGRNRVREARG